MLPSNKEDKSKEKEKKRYLQLRPVLYMTRLRRTYLEPFFRLIRNYLLARARTFLGGVRDAACLWQEMKPGVDNQVKPG